MVKRLKVNFFNNGYVIKTDAEEVYVHKVVSYLEDKVKEVSQSNNSMVIPRSILLVMLKIADDYFRISRDFEEFKYSAEKKSKELVQILDNSLQEKEALGFSKGIRGEEFKAGEFESSCRRR